MEKGSPPELYKELASDIAVIKRAKESSFSFKWSSNGESVSSMYKGKPIATIHQKYQRGFSRALSLESGFGMPWNNGVYSSEFDASSFSID